MFARKWLWDFQEVNNPIPEMNSFLRPKTLRGSPGAQLHIRWKQLTCTFAWARMATRGDLQREMLVIQQSDNQNDGSGSFPGWIGAISPHIQLGFSASSFLFTNKWLTTYLMFELSDSSCRQLNMINSTTGSETLETYTAKTGIQLGFGCMLWNSKKN